MSIIIDNYKKNLKLLLSISETARITGLDRAYIRYCIKEGLLEVFSPPGRTRTLITLDSVMTFINNHTYIIERNK